DVPGATVSGSGARLQRAADRLDDHRHRPSHYDDVAVQYVDRSPARSALDAGDRARPVRLLDVSDRHADQSDRLLGAVCAAGGPGPGADLRLSPGQFYLDCQFAAG